MLYRHPDGRLIIYIQLQSTEVASYALVSAAFVVPAARCAGVETAMPMTFSNRCAAVSRITSISTAAGKGHPPWTPQSEG